MIKYTYFMYSSICFIKLPYPNFPNLLALLRASAGLLILNVTTPIASFIAAFRKRGGLHGTNEIS